MSTSRKPVIQACNLLSVTGGARRLFQFTVSKGTGTATGDLVVEDGKPLPTAVVSRDWRVLIKPRLDLAWLPLESVCVRAVQLPTCDPGELPGIIEFQIEKLSPMPLAQVVWTVESVPHADGKGQTAVVTLAARAATEAYLAELEKGGYTVDALLNPSLRELLASPPPRDGLLLLVESAAAASTVLAAWWIDGVLREIGSLCQPSGDRGTVLISQLNRMAWSGEVEGWMNGLPEIRLMASSTDAALYLEALKDWSGHEPLILPRRTPPELAALTLAHALRPSLPTLVPDEVRDRQRRQFVDTLWVKGLGALAMTYLAGVFVYLAVLTLQKSRLETLRDENRGMALQFTNTLQIKARVRVLQEQVALRFAALDCWNKVAETLPETMTLKQFDFKNGRTLILEGTTTEASRADITGFNSTLRAVEVNGKLLFSEVKPATTQLRRNDLTWRFEADLRREDSAP